MLIRYAPRPSHILAWTSFTCRSPVVGVDCRVPYHFQSRPPVANSWRISASQRLHTGSRPTLGCLRNVGGSSVFSRSLRVLYEQRRRAKRHPKLIAARLRKISARFPIRRAPSWSAIEKPSTTAEISSMKEQSHAQDKEAEVFGTSLKQDSTPPILITLDAFETLFEPREPVAKQYAEVAGTFGIKVHQQDMEDSFKSAFRTMNARYPNYGKESSENISPRLWWDLLIEEAFKPHAVMTELKDELYERFASKLGYTLYPDVLPLLEAIEGGLSPEDWPPSSTMLGVISNSDPRVAEILRSLNIRVAPRLSPPTLAPYSTPRKQAITSARFSFLTLSYHAGVSKPDPRIFEFALRDAERALARLAPNQRISRSGAAVLRNIRTHFIHLHIGDDLEKDVLPALRAGWAAILLDRSAAPGISERVLEDGTKVMVLGSLEVGVMRQAIRRISANRLVE